MLRDTGNRAAAALFSRGSGLHSIPVPIRCDEASERVATSRHVHARARLHGAVPGVEEAIRPGLQSANAPAKDQETDLANTARVRGRIQERTGGRMSGVLHHWVTRAAESRPDARAVIGE